MHKDSARLARMIVIDKIAANMLEATRRGILVSEYVGHSVMHLETVMQQDEVQSLIADVMIRFKEMLIDSEITGFVYSHNGSATFPMDVLDDIQRFMRTSA